MENVVKFNKKGYDPFIDFIKAYSILCVLLGHTFPFLDETGYSLWYGMQVPLFVLVQVFHSFKKDAISFNVQNITKRILIPYLLVQLGIFFVFVIFSDSDIRTVLLKFTMGGGRPWVLLSLGLYSVGVVAPCC